MSFLLDTDTCSAHLKRPSGLMHRFTQHSGVLYLSTIVLGELYAWAYNRPDPSQLLHLIEGDLLSDVRLLDFDAKCASEFGKLRASLRQRGISVGRADLMIASIALVHNLTLVTHNTSDYRDIVGLRLEDWLLN